MIYLPAERQGEPLQRESFAGSSGYGLREKRTARTGPSRTLQSDTPKQSENPQLWSAEAASESEALACREWFGALRRQLFHDESIDEPTGKPSREQPNEPRPRMHDVSELGPLGFDDFFDEP